MAHTHTQMDACQHAAVGMPLTHTVNKMTVYIKQMPIGHHFNYES